MTARTSALRWKHYGSASLVAAGLVSGGLLLGASGASATESSTSPAPSASSSTSQTTTSTVHKAHPRHWRGTPLTGPVADKVKAAALAKYPGATVRRVDTDSHGVYEAHLVTTAGTHVTVKVSKTFTVTSVRTSARATGHDAGHTARAGSTPARP
jgi:hypothetical protein